MPMNGVKVVEACSNIAGPVTGTIFGDLGAEVIKIEKPNGGDDARAWSPPVLHGMGARFQAINRNKLSVTLDLKNPHDKSELKRLVAEADVFVHNMRPGVAESLELSGPEALTLNPRLIYCAIGAYGSKGPWRTWSAYDGLAQALSSQMFGNGEPDGQPLLVADALVDKGAGMWAAIAILAALHDRAKTGKGSIVETSLLEAALFWRDGVFAQYVASGRLPRRPGNGSAQVVPYGVFPTADQPIMLGLAGGEVQLQIDRPLGRSDAADVVAQDRHAAAVSLLAQTLEDLLSAVRVGVQQPRDARLEGIKDTAARPAAARLEARTRYPRRHCLWVETQRPGSLRDRQALAIMAVVDFAERLVVDHDRLRSQAQVLPPAPRM
jgi:crotonobetainyl-CoA:carnitine CoA-transferase CaiB-like acyl-CoA transferase